MSEDPEQEKIVSVAAKHRPLEPWPQEMMEGTRETSPPLIIYNQAAPLNPPAAAVDSDAEDEDALLYKLLTSDPLVYEVELPDDTPLVCKPPQTPPG